MNRKWNIRPTVPGNLLEKFPELEPILLQLLFARGIQEQPEIDAFLEPDYPRDVYDPFLFRDMRIAVERIARAITAKERIVVYGDYDADGVCASAVLVGTLKALGGNVDVYIPFRETEGYGLNIAAVDELHNTGTTLIVTVDCGTTNAPEVAHAREYGIDVIVTDHHDEPSVMPSPVALINPELSRETYPEKHLSGTGVAYKVACALLTHTAYGAKLGMTALPTGWEKWLLDLVAIATVTDMVPMLGENRVLTSFGLSVLKKGRRIGIRALFTTMRSTLEETDEEVIGFQIGPRLNAAGRMQHASTAFELLTTTDRDEAMKLAAELSQKNTERQKITESIVQEALQQIGDSPTGALLYAVGTDWPAGVVGLVAGKLVERFNRPALVFTKAHGRYTGSGRSIDAFDITAALKQTADMLDRFGGHPQACGLSVKDGVDPRVLGVKLEDIARRALDHADVTPTVDIDAEVVLDDINWKLVEDVQRLAPFGMDAERPRFLARGVRVVAVDTVGKEGKHLRLHVSHATSEIRKTIGFRFGMWVERLKPGDSVDLVFEVGVNEWNGNREIELKLVDLDHSAEPESTA